MSQVRELHSPYLTMQAYAQPVSEAPISPEFLYGKDVPIAQYYHPKKNPIPAFRDQFMTLIHLFEQWGTDEKCTITNKVAHGFAALKRNFFDESYSGMQKSRYFKVIKFNLEQILLTLRSDKLPLPHRKEAYINLCKEFSECAPGLYTHIVASFWSLTQYNASVSRWLTVLRTTIVERFANQHIERNRVTPGNSIHAINSFVTYAANCGWPVTLTAAGILDPLASHAQISEEDIIAFHTYCKSEYSLSAIKQCIQQNLMDSLRELCRKHGYTELYTTNQRVMIEQGQYMPLINKFEAVLKGTGIVPDFKAPDYFPLYNEDTAFSFDWNKCEDKVHSFCDETLFSEHAKIFYYYDPINKDYLTIVPPKWLVEKNADPEHFPHRIWNSQLSVSEVVSRFRNLTFFLTNKQIQTLLQELPIWAMGAILQDNLLSDYHAQCISILNQIKSRISECSWYLVDEFSHSQKDGLKKLNSYIYIIQTLKLDGFLDKKNYGCTPLFSAARYADTELVLALIAAKANVDSQDNLGTTPLHMAAANGRLQCVKALIAAGANLDTKDNSKNETALYKAFAKKRIECVSELLASNAKINAGRGFYLNNLIKMLVGSKKPSTYKALKNLLTQYDSLSLADKKHYNIRPKYRGLAEAYLKKSQVTDPKPKLHSEQHTLFKHKRKHINKNEEGPQKNVKRVRAR